MNGVGWIDGVDRVGRVGVNGVGRVGVEWVGLG